MPANNKVKKNVTTYVKPSWREALHDAERGLEKAQLDVMRWKGTIQICRKKVAEDAHWPGTKPSTESNQGA
jgi:hypothetical protein